MSGHAACMVTWKTCFNQCLSSGQLQSRPRQMKSKWLTDADPQRGRAEECCHHEHQQDVDPGQVDRHGQQGKGLAKQALTSLQADARVAVHPFTNRYWAYLGCLAGVDCKGVGTGVHSMHYSRHGDGDVAQPITAKALCRGLEGQETT